MEAIILAGGFGTRLRSVVADLPKCLAPINQNPFLKYLVDDLSRNNFTHIIFSLGFNAHIVQTFIENVLKKQYPSLVFEYVIEYEPLGTGGAIQFALTKSKQENTFILNGDTFFNIPYKTLLQNHLNGNAICSLALKKMVHFDRYGTVKINKQNQIIAFEEKKQNQKGTINGGIYIINKSLFLKKQMPPIFSFEKDFLEKNIYQNVLNGYIFPNYFIDIGIPQDFKKAQIDFKVLFKDLI